PGARALRSGEAQSKHASSRPSSIGAMTLPVEHCSQRIARGARVVDDPGMRDAAAFNLANNIRSLREARGLTQQQMAKLSGVPRPTWANLESGAANPTLAVLVRVAAALQIRVEELIGPPKASARFYRSD